MDLFKELEGVERMLDFHTQRHGVLAGNLVNADTPGYQAKELSFSGVLQQHSGLQATDAKHFGPNQLQQGGWEFETTEQSPSVDDNGVNVQHTLAQITANRLRFQEGTELARRRVGILRYGATDGSQS